MILRLIKNIIISLLFLHSSLFATKYAGEFLSVGLGSAAMGMGGAYVSIATDAFAGYWNPAGSPSTSHQLIFAHSSNFGSLISHDALGYSRPMGQYNIGLIYIRLAVKDIPYTNDALIDLNNNGIMDDGERLDYNKIIYNNDVESALLLNYNRKYSNMLRWGINLKAINKSIGPNSAWGLGFDAGAMFTGWNRFKLGFNLTDITTTYLAWDNGTKEIISPALHIGSSYHPTIFKEKPLSFALTGDFRFEGRQTSANYYYGSISLDLHAGVEYWLKKKIAVRLGGDQGRFTAGAGLRLGRFNFDYAYMAHKYLESSTKLSGSFTF
jgi:hypothetical protein